MGSCQKQKQFDVTSSLQDVIVPFRECSSSETSSFSTQIPCHYAPNRLFHFSRLFLSPKLFNIEAKELKLEVKVEDQVVDSFPVSLSAQFSNAKAFFPNTYKNKMATTNAFITSVNNYFDPQKPEFAMQCQFFSTGWTSTIRATFTKLMLNSLAWYIIMHNTIRTNTQEICLNWWPPWKGSTIEESNWHHERGDGFGQISIQAVGGTVYQNNLFQQCAPPQIGLCTQTIWIKDSFQTNWNCQSLLPLQGRAWRSQHAQYTL